MPPSHGKEHLLVEAVQLQQQVLSELHLTGLGFCQVSEGEGKAGPGIRVWTGTDGEWDHGVGVGQEDVRT